MSKLIRINEITQEELDILQCIDTDCLKMHVLVPPKVFLDLNVYNSNGQHILEYKRLSKTWVRNAYNVLTMQLMGLPANINGTSAYEAGKLMCKSTAGSLRGGTAWIGNGGWESSGSTIGNLDIAGDNTLGIVVGTGDGAESFEGYALQTIIAHGTGAGQLSYQAMANAVPSYNAGTKVFTAVHRRSFVNNSGNTITVKETGFIYGLAYTASGSFPTWDKFLMSRDLLASPVNVTNGATLTVDYTFTLTYPA
jgi:hypothetical protein